MRRSGGRTIDLPWLGLLYLVALLSGVWGFGAARYRWFPYHVFEAAASSLLAAASGVPAADPPTLAPTRQMRRQVHRRGEDVAFSHLTGFHRIDQDFVDPGYLLLSRWSKEQRQVVAELVRLSDFTVLHRWVPPLGQVRARGPGAAEGPPAAGLEVVHPLLLDAGSLVFGSGGGPLARVDRESRLEWVLDGRFHHSIERDAEGNLVAPVVIDPPTRSLPLPYQDDGYATVSPDGRLLAQRSLTDILMTNGYDVLLFGIGRFERDRIHLADAHPVLQAAGAALPGDLLLSARNLSTVLLYRPSTGAVAWLATGPWLNQHDVDPREDGRVWVLGNDVIRHGSGVTQRGEASEVYLYDPVAGEAATPYTAALEEIGARTRTRGAVRVLRDDDLILLLHQPGQIFRLGSDGARWVYVNGQSDWSVGMVHGARYYHPDEIDLGWLAPPPSEPHGRRP